MNDALVLISSIPTTIWVAIISPMISAASVLFGVFLSNRGHIKRLRAQFSHERQVRNEDRAYSIKKECLLNAIAALNIGVRQAGAIPNLNIASAELVLEFTRRSDDIAKAIMIANQETAITIQRAVRIISNIFVSNLAERTKLEAKNLHYQNSRQLEENLKIDYQKIKSELKGLAPIEDHYEAKRDIILREIADAKSILNNQIQLNIELFQEMIQDTARLATRVTDDIFNNSENIFDPTIKARNELGIEGDLEEFIQVVEQFRAEFKERHEILLSELQSLARDPLSQPVPQKV